MNKIRKTAVLLLAAVSMASLAGCGDKEQEGTENVSGVEESGKRSGQIELNYEELVTDLCDYSSIPVTITSDYTVTDEYVEVTLMSLLNSYGIGTKEVTDRNIVEAGDYVKVDYTGYLDGEAFDRGADEDVMLDVSNNKEVTTGTVFIDGFSDGLIGAEVGTTVSSDVTFPEKYDNNPDLAGKLTTFEFKVKGIYKPITAEDLEDDVVNETFGATYNLKTKDDLINYVRGYLEDMAESQVYNLTVDAIRSYMIENCKVEVPEEYLSLRIAEYEASMAADFCEEGQSLEDYVTANYNMTYEDAVAEWSEYLEKQVKVELIFSRVAQLEEIKVDETGFAAYVQNFVGNTNYDFADANAVYEYFGNGYADEGEAYLRQLYVVNKTIDSLVPNADITYDFDTEEAEGDSGASTEGDSGTDTEEDSGTDTEGDSGADTEGDSGTDTEEDSGADTEGDSGTDTEEDSGADTEGESGQTAD